MHQPMVGDSRLLPPSTRTVQRYAAMLLSGIGAYAHDSEEGAQTTTRRARRGREWRLSLEGCSRFNQGNGLLNVSVYGGGHFVEKGDDRH